MKKVGVVLADPVDGHKYISWDHMPPQEGSPIYIARPDIETRARRAVEENPRHSTESLGEMLMREFPEATEREIDDAVEYGLAA